MRKTNSFISATGHPDINMIMKTKIIILPLIVLACFCFSFKQNTLLSISQVYKVLSPTKSAVSKKEIVGQFSYTANDSQNGKFVSVFSTSFRLPLISHISFSDDRKDILLIGKKRFELSNKIDPLSLKVFRIKWNNKQFIAFMGKGQSASGSGVQLTYFILAKLNSPISIASIHEFESRFGNMDCIIDYNRDGTLDYFKITNGKKASEYNVTINETESDKSVTTANALLQYKLNDRFLVINNSLSK